MALKNEFLEARVAKIPFSSIAESAAAQALTSGVYLPAGALVTGITVMCSDAPTVANASNHIGIMVYNTQNSSSVQLASTALIKNVASAQTVPTILTLVSTAGMYVPVSGELGMSVSASSGTNAITWSPIVYVGYIA
jgi:hypothetical protein